MSKKGGILKKINIIDLCVVLIVILLIIGANMKFKKFHYKTEETQISTLKYKMQVNNIRDYTIDAIQVGDTVYDSQTGIMIGTVSNIEKSNAKTYEGTTKGEIIEVYNPERYDLTLTIETPGSSETNAFYANNTVELKVNSSKTIETKYVRTTGTISEIDVQ